MELPVSILKLRKLRELSVYHQGNYSENYRFSGLRSPTEIGRLSLLENLDSIVAENDEVVREIEIWKVHSIEDVRHFQAKQRKWKQYLFHCQSPLIIS